MAAENRFSGAIGASQDALRRVSARIAALTFWQFLLLAMVLLAAAEITEGLWNKPATHRIRIKDDRPSASANKREARPASSAEIRIGEDGVVIRGKAVPEDKGASPPAVRHDTDVSPASEPGTAQEAPGSEAKEIRIGKDLIVIRKGKSATAGERSGPEVRIAGVQLSDEDVAEIASAADTAQHARPPALVTITLLLVLALFVMRMFARAQQRAEKKTEAAQAIAECAVLQRQVAEARLQLLQAQVEPHFLFNSLAAVEHLIETAPERAAKMQRHLIDYLRAAVPRMRQQSATLGQEIGLCVSYLEIMQMRMEERLQFKVTVPAGLASASFPPMMIQSLIENSVRHGLEPKPEGGIIDLTAEVRDGKLCVTVTDTGLGFSTNARTGVGLANIRERLQQLFDAAGTLTIEPNPPGGTRATITVPYAVT